jgi:hypothetical protein
MHSSPNYPRAPPQKKKKKVIFSLATTLIGNIHARFLLYFVCISYHFTELYIFDKVHPFKVYNSLTTITINFRTFLSVTPERNPVPISSHFPLPSSLFSPVLGSLIYFRYLWAFLYWTFSINGIVKYVSVTTVFLSIIFSKFIHIVIF